MSAADQHAEAHGAQRKARAKNLTVRTTDDFADDLAVVTGAVQPDGTKLDRTAAVHRAVRLLANAYCRSWDYQDVLRGTAPDVVSVRYRTTDGAPERVPVVPGRPVHEIPVVHEQSPHERTTHGAEPEPPPS